GEKNAGRRMERGHHAHPVPHTRLGEKPLHFIGQVKELHFLTRVKLYSLRFDQHDRSPSPSYSLLVSASAVPARGRGTAPAPSRGNSGGPRSNEGRKGGGILCRKKAPRAMSRRAPAAPAGRRLPAAPPGRPPLRRPEAPARPRRSATAYCPLPPPCLD